MGETVGRAEGRRAVGEWRVASGQLKGAVVQYWQAYQVSLRVLFAYDGIFRTAKQSEESQSTIQVRCEHAQPFVTVFTNAGTEVQEVELERHGKLASAPIQLIVSRSFELTAQIKGLSKSIVNAPH